MGVLAGVYILLRTVTSFKLCWYHKVCCNCVDVFGVQLFCTPIQFNRCLFCNTSFAGRLLQWGWDLVSEVLGWSLSPDPPPTHFWFLCWYSCTGRFTVAWYCTGRGSSYAGAGTTQAVLGWFHDCTAISAFTMIIKTKSGWKNSFNQINDYTINSNCLYSLTDSPMGMLGSLGVAVLQEYFVRIFSGA